MPKGLKRGLVRWIEMPLQRPIGRQPGVKETDTQSFAGVHPRMPSRVTREEWAFVTDPVPMPVEAYCGHLNRTWAIQNSLLVGPC